jgi:hypothetical protein
MAQEGSWVHTWAAPASARVPPADPPPTTPPRLLLLLRTAAGVQRATTQRQPPRCASAASARAKALFQQRRRRRQRARATGSQGEATEAVCLRCPPPRPPRPLLALAWPAAPPHSWSSRGWEEARRQSRAASLCLAYHPLPRLVTAPLCPRPPRPLLALAWPAAPPHSWSSRGWEEARRQSRAASLCLAYHPLPRLVTALRRQCLAQEQAPLPHSNPNSPWSSPSPSSGVAASGTVDANMDATVSSTWVLAIECTMSCAMEWVSASMPRGARTPSSDPPPTASITSSRAPSCMSLLPCYPAATPKGGGGTVGLRLGLRVGWRHHPRRCAAWCVSTAKSPLGARLPRGQRLSSEMAS